MSTCTTLKNFKSVSVSTALSVMNVLRQHRNSMKMNAKEQRKKKEKKESANKMICITCFCHRYLPSESVPDKRAKEPLRNDTENGSEDDGDDELELKLDAATDDDDDNDDGNIS